MSVRRSIWLAFVGANLLGWIIILGTREATPWAELERRRPHRSGTGVTFEANTAWGTPLFGREIGGDFAEGPVVSGFVLINLPGFIAAQLIYFVLEMSPLRIGMISWMMGVAALGISTMQWFFVGRMVGHLRQRSNARA